MNRAIARLEVGLGLVYSDSGTRTWLPQRLVTVLARVRALLGRGGLVTRRSDCNHRSPDGSYRDLVVRALALLSYDITY